MANLKNRKRTDLRYVDRISGQVTRVTEFEGMYFIGDTDKRAEKCMTHFNGVKHIKNKKVKYKVIDDEWSDFAHTSDDL